MFHQQHKLEDVNKEHFSQAKFNYRFANFIRVFSVLFIGMGIFEFLVGTIPKGTVLTVAGLTCHFLFPYAKQLVEEAIENLNNIKDSLKHD